MRRERTRWQWDECSPRLWQGRALSAPGINTAALQRDPDPACQGDVSVLDPMGLVIPSQPPERVGIPLQ